MSISDDSGALDYELARRQAGAEPIRLPPLRFIVAAVVAAAIAVSIYLVGRHGDPAREQPVLVAHVSFLPGICRWYGSIIPERY